MLHILREAASGWSRHNAPRLGAALAYYTVLSLAPVLILVLAVSGIVFGQQASTGEIYWQVRNVAGPQVALAIQGLLKSAHTPGAGVLASILGFVTILFGASGVFVELRGILNFIWDAPVHDESFCSIIRERFRSFAIVLGAGILLVASLGATAFLQARSAYSAGYLRLPAPVLQTSNFLVSLAVTAFLFALIYRFIPEVRVHWRDVTFGALLTALLFSVGKLLIGLYLGRAGVGSAYGAAGSLVILLVWVYYSVQIFLFGAELTYVWAQRQRSRSTK
jgi:membrane protein